MKFFKLLKKELVELLSVQTLVGLVVALVMFMVLGNVMGGIGEKVEKSNSSVVVCDLDNSATSKEALSWLEAGGFKIDLIEGESDTALLQKASELDHDVFLKIPSGFEAELASEKPQSLEVISALKSFSMFSNMDSSASSAADAIGKALTAKLLAEKVPNIDAEYLQNPVVVTENTFVGEKSATISSDMLISIALQQSIFIPIIVFLLITFASQLNISAIANEKTDKTLETLLSTPVSRLSVLGAKMTASAVFSLLMAAVFMIGFSTYMGGVTGMATGGADIPSASNSVLASLGLQLSLMQYILLGVQLFFTICISLVISLLLGALAKDLKSAQGLLTPLMFMVMIPYFITMFLDVNSLPMIAKVIVYAIPFTHTFTATANLLFHNDMLFIIGVLYQAIFLAGILYVAVRVFSSDKIFTMTLSLNKKKGKKKEIAE